MTATTRTPPSSDDAIVADARVTRVTMRVSLTLKFIKSAIEGDDAIEGGGASLGAGGGYSVQLGGYS